MLSFSLPSIPTHNTNLCCTSHHEAWLNRSTWCPDHHVRVMKIVRFNSANQALAFTMSETATRLLKKHQKQRNGNGGEICCMSRSPAVASGSLGELPVCAGVGGDVWTSLRCTKVQVQGCWCIGDVTVSITRVEVYVKIHKWNSYFQGTSEDFFV
jgi:hypothetical protein